MNDEQNTSGGNQNGTNRGWRDGTKTSSLMSPCLHCPDRCEGCHGRCDAYAEYQKTRDVIRKAKQADYEYNEVFAEKLKRLHRMFGKKRR